MQQISRKGVSGETQLGGKDNPFGIDQEIEIWPYYEMVYAQTRINQRGWEALNSLRFWDAKRSPHPGKKSRQTVNERRGFGENTFCH